MEQLLRLSWPSRLMTTPKAISKNWFRGLFGVGLLLSAMVVIRAVTHDSTGDLTGDLRKNQLKQIGAALALYHEAYGSLPPAYTVDADGRKLHSWRTLLLPFLGQKELYDQIDLNRPWEDLANREVLDKGVFTYSAPSRPDNRLMTSYVVVVGEMTCFPGVHGIANQDIRDGTSNTIAVVEVPYDRAIPWMSTQDLDEKQFLEMAKSKSRHEDAGSLALFADGSVRFIKSDVNPISFLAIVTRYGDYFGCSY